ncbi:MAG: heparan-alpha-glucosaminide N-acetyltransferase [Casimicrobiaceae bacterium]
MAGQQRAAPTSAPAVAVAAPGRVAAIDNLRGLAIIAMVVYHFCFDLRHFGFITADMYRDPFWLHARTAILSSFLLLAGISLVLAQRDARGRDRFWRHVLRVAAAALLVSAASYVVFPQRYIWFGVLHAIAISLVLVRPLISRPALALALGVALLVAGNTWSSPWFDHRTWGWMGFMTAKPATEDYVPLVPWTGMILLGMALAYPLQRNGFQALAVFARLPPWLGAMGRHSLAIYLIHQPLLFGALFLVAKGWRT